LSEVGVSGKTALLVGSGGVSGDADTNDDDEDDAASFLDEELGKRNTDFQLADCCGRGEG